MGKVTSDFTSLEGKVIVDTIEQRICEAIDARKDEIINFATDIWNHAELGFQEYRTAKKFTEALRRCGLESQTNMAVTGVKSCLKGRVDGPSICLMGEFDALPIPNSPHVNPKTGAAHCCGHNAQIAGVIGAAMALTLPDVRTALDGNVVFFGVPAEEYIEIALRNRMREQGLIRYGCGKCELLRLNALDDVDIVVGHHAACVKEYLVANRSCNGFVTKMVRFEGRAAHAAGDPQHGVDSMMAAEIAMHAVNVQRESFYDEDTIRIHGRASGAGEATNIIADDVRLEYSIRGKTIASYMDAAKKVDRAMRAGAVATGCGLSISTLPGNLPIVPVRDASVVREALEIVADGTPVTETGPDVHSTSSGDYGDISCLMPLLQFNTGGFSGALHSPSVEVGNPYEAYVEPAKIFALIAYRLLRNGAVRARGVMDEFVPTLTRKGYIELMESQLVTEHLPMAPLFAPERV
ncbi:amidohydrolase [Pyramidobacter sp. SM-530-WT-4B]|uniref:Amidohydrolase n=1 Tax=Pyramidobacter porci TaxID=2605789 RepID=A0A6L5YCZ1_9BACT|nr:amidohydrolase [Pyramidobacter porci]